VTAETEDARIADEAAIAQAERADRIERLLLEVAELWPALQVGEVNLNVLYSRGRVRRTYVHWGPISPGNLGEPIRP